MINKLFYDIIFYDIILKLLPITENGYPFKRIFKTDRVWSLVETFCEIRRFVNGSRFIRSQ